MRVFCHNFSLFALRNVGIYGGLISLLAKPLPVKVICVLSITLVLCVWQLGSWLLNSLSLLLSCRPQTLRWLVVYSKHQNLLPFLLERILDPSQLLQHHFLSLAYDPERL